MNAMLNTNKLQAQTTMTTDEWSYWVVAGAQAEARTLRGNLEGAVAAREAAMADARAQADASAEAARAHAARAEGLSADVARLTAESAALQAQVAERGAAGSAADPQARLGAFIQALPCACAAASCCMSAAALVSLMWRGCRWG